MGYPAGRFLVGLWGDTNEAVLEALASIGRDLIEVFQMETLLGQYGIGVSFW